MLFKAIVPKIGDAKSYINKPFRNESGDIIGSIIDVIEKECGFELIIDAKLDFLDIGRQKAYYSISSNFKNMKTTDRIKY